MISPIREVYAGTSFRSTLEAEWARHLDHVGTPWLYEPEGLTLSDGTLYRPDFYLPALDCWLEVKGPGVPRVEKAYRLAADGERVLIGYPSVRGRVHYGWADSPIPWNPAEVIAVIGWPFPDPKFDTWPTTVNHVWYGR